MARFVLANDTVINLDHVSLISRDENTGRTRIYMLGDRDPFLILGMNPVDILTLPAVLEYHDTPQTLRRIK